VMHGDASADAQMPCTRGAKLALYGVTFQILGLSQQLRLTRAETSGMDP
jgi:hypothetical protein